jgi:hypothetical protein
MARGRRTRLLVLTIAAAGSLALAGPAPSRPPTVLPARGFEARPTDHALRLPDGEADELRGDALARASLWRDPGPLANLRDNPTGPGAGGFGAADTVPCKFYPDEASGRTPKFECVFEGGEVLKVKYGANPEVHTEVAASRLLAALGAGADHMYLVKAVRCFGCPEDPHALVSCLSSPFELVRRSCRPNYGTTSATGEFTLRLDYGKYVDFPIAAIERRLEGKEIRTKEKQGWGWDELEEAGRARRGASRAERDALRLLAVLLNDWDNRSDNQRLQCLPGGYSAGSGRCSQPFAYLHDVGGTFGRVGGDSKRERKLDVEGWSQVPIWKDARTCTVAIDSPPLHGATFGEATISEAGRIFLAERLGRLSEGQIRDLFEGARFADYAQASQASRNPENWVRAFQAKVRQVVERAPCPAS